MVKGLRSRYETDCVRFANLLGDAPHFHGALPGIGDCAILGYTRRLDTAGAGPTAPSAGWLDRMQALPEMKAPTGFFPAPG